MEELVNVVLPSSYEHINLKIDSYKHSLVYMKHMVTTNQKSTRFIQKIKRKKSKHNT